MPCEIGAPELTPTGRLALKSDEVELRLLTGVVIEQTNERAPKGAKQGELHITNQRITYIIPSDVERSATISLTNIEYASEPKRNKLTNASPRLALSLKQGKAIQFVLRGERVAGVAKEVNEAKSEATEAEKRQARRRGTEHSNNANAAQRAGIAGVLQRQEEEASTDSEALKEGFKDLRSLSERARELVDVSRRLQRAMGPEKGGEGSADTREAKEERSEVESMLIDVGLETPMTRPKGRDEKDTEALAKDVADFFLSEGRIDRLGGVVTLADAFCLVNRAKGASLVSPDDLRRAAKHLERVGTPLHLQKFDSGLMAIAKESRTKQAMRDELLAMAREDSTVGIGEKEAAHALKIAPLLAKEHLHNAEANGELCRDEGPTGISFFLNRFV